MTEESDGLTCSPMGTTSLASHSRLRVMQCSPQRAQGDEVLFRRCEALDSNLEHHCKLAAVALLHVLQQQQHQQEQALQFTSCALRRSAPAGRRVPPPALPPSSRKPCSRAYTHDWTECPFAHPGENARRRDPRRVPYSCVPCPDFRRDPAACRKGDGCEYAHGVFESWLHPAQYRTRLCKDEVGCPRRICFFAHGTRQLRAVNPSTASMASPSPSSSPSPPRSSSSSSRPALTASLSSRELDLDADNQKQYARRMMMARAGGGTRRPAGAERRSALKENIYCLKGDKCNYVC
ncbi:RING finger protein unkempt homolog [Triticum dicoccoides]|uniref:RING finger protein unkempt homolog n=1 Tax=Triticum dicoccoides TaxID=85692 RepID=UPI00188FC27D|nr:RING finger protein unkempt homolog [Triticum dicoccoides]